MHQTALTANGGAARIKTLRPITARRTVTATWHQPRRDVAQTSHALRDPAAPIVDVREPEEWVEGHIPGVRHIPLGISLAGPLSWTRHYP